MNLSSVFSRALSSALAFVVLGLGVGCTSEPELPSGQCLYDSNCSDGQVCVSFYCRQPCQADRDCGAGGRCVHTADGTVCARAGQPSPCAYSTDCPAGEICTREGTCQSQCRADYDCEVANPYQRCRGGVCGLFCERPRLDCNSDVRDGCETDVRESTEHCGACNNHCATGAHQLAACRDGACVARCEAGWGDCNNDLRDGCEADLSLPAHCGACGTACSPSAPRCTRDTSSGAAVMRCALVCDGATPATCGSLCVDLMTDAQHCGSCATVCPAGPNSQARCVAGRCAVTCSDTSHADCDGDGATGCETDLPRDTAHCGTCGVACSGADNASAACVSGTCGLSCSMGYGDCDGAVTNGCEADLNTTVTACGACGTSCPAVSNAQPRCASGRCTFTCQDGFGDCDGDPSNGCEVNLQTTAAHCASCAHACAAMNGTAGCAMGVCTIGACGAGYADCDNDPGNGCETNTQTNAAACGRCGNVCRFDGAGARCDAGTCVRTACAAGLGDCDANSANGCETTLATSTANCGACGNACRLANAVSRCTAGACAIASCNPGFADCDGSATNGCEVNLNTTVTSCGSCGQACSANNGTATCAGGACAIACTAGWGDCDRNVGNGCETNTTNTTAHCGACGIVCDPPHATGGCSASRCVVAACDAGWADCDNNPANGCEVDLQNDVRACGRCGGVCSTNNGTPSCTAGRCAITCRSGYGDCNGQVGDGCETNTTSTPAHCGACGRRCALAHATAGCAANTCTIAVCDPGWADCDGNAANGCETDTTSAPAHCGACENACRTGQVCSASRCTNICGPPTTFCSGRCVNLTTDPANCGACGTLCSYPNGNGGCRSGRCYLAGCNTGWGDCDQNASNGCEINLSSTPSSCGACGAACALPNATAGCTSGTCTVAACNAGYADCDGVASNGCEASLATPTNCGACGRACSLANASSSCSTGTCRLLRCYLGYANCDGNAANGCEIATSSDNNNCGACGNVCAAGTTCVNSACRPSNDTCAGATVLSLAASRVNVAFNTVNAVHDTGAPTPCMTPGQGDVFFRFTLTQREVIVADTFGVNFDTMLFFASGATCAAFTRIRIPGAVWCNDEASTVSGGPGCAGVTNASQVAGVFEPGTYYLVVSNAGAAGGLGVLHFEHLPVTTVGSVNYLPQAATGEQFYNRYYFQPAAGSISTTCGAGGRGPEHSFWWRTCPSQPPVRLTANTCYGAREELRDTVLELRNGTGSGTLCNDDQGTSCTLSTTSKFVTTLPAGAGLHTVTFDLYSIPASGVYSSVVFNEIIITDSRRPEGDSVGARSVPWCSVRDHGAGVVGSS